MLYYINKLIRPFDRTSFFQQKSTQITKTSFAVNTASASIFRSGLFSIFGSGLFNVTRIPVILQSKKMPIVSEPPIVSLNLTTEDASRTGDLCFKEMDEKALAEVLKLIRFCNNANFKRVRVYATNDMTDDSCYCTITKDSLGHYFFAPADEEYGPVYTFLKRHLQNPDELLSIAYHLTGNEINTWARITSENSRGTLSKKAELLKTDATDDNKAIDKVLLAVEAITVGGWLKKSDLDFQCHVSDVMTLLRFYQKNLEKKDPYLKKISDALKVFENQRIQGDPVDIAINVVEKDLKKNEDKIASDVLGRLSFTLNNVKTLWYNRAVINAIRDPKKRENFANKYFSLGDEGGVLSCRTPEEITLQFLKTYQRAKRAKKLYLFDGLKRDPCFTVRMRVIDAATALLFENIKPEEAESIPQSVQNFPACVLAEVFNNIGEGKKDPVRFLNSLSPKDFLNNEEYLKAIIDQFKAWEKRETYGDNSDAFVKFLKEKALIPQQGSIDWDSFIPDFIRSPYFGPIKALAVSTCSP